MTAITLGMILRVLALIAFAAAAFAPRIDKVSVIAVGLGLWVLSTIVV